MEFKEQEVADGKLWLLCAGACAVALSVFVWKVDEYMVNAAAREHKHNLVMNELRSAQTHLAAAPIDNRQALPLTIEAGEGAPLPHDVGGAEAGHHDAHGSGH